MEMDVMAVRGHVTIEDLLRFRDSELEPPATKAIGLHLADCPDCAALARSLFGGEPATLHGTFAEERAPVARGPWRAWMAIAASVVLIAAASIALISRNREAPPAPTAETTAPPIPTAKSPAPAHGKPEWTAIVDDALRSGRIAAPAVVARLQSHAATLRGEADAAQGLFVPAGVVIEERRPLLRWSTSTPGPYVVTLSSGDRAVVTSPPIQRREWTPPPLERGKTYVWQVSLPDQSVLPVPPAPKAMFHVIDEQTWRELVEARRSAPADHLLLGVLAARAGLQTEAARELTAYLRERPNDVAAVRLLDSLKSHRR
jgi:hypothetical protein